MRKAINHLRKSDPTMSAIIERVGACRISYGDPSFASLAEAIVYQQLNGRPALHAGDPTLRRQTRRFGVVHYDDGTGIFDEAYNRFAGLLQQHHTKIAVNDVPRSGKPEELLHLFGLDAASIAAKVRELVG